MRDRITRTEIGSVNPFDILRRDVEDKNDFGFVPGDIEDDVNSGVIDQPKAQNTPESQTPPNEVDDNNGKTGDVDVNKKEDVDGEDITPDSVNVKIKTNIPKLLAERLKADNQLPEDFEVTDTTTATDVENAYRKYLSDKVREEERNEALQSLREEGYDDTVLDTAKKLHYGVPEQEIRLEQAYSMLGSLEIDSSDENYEKLSKTLFQQYYLDKGLSIEEATKNSDRDYADATEEEIKGLIDSRKNYFNSRAIQLDQDHKDAIKKARKDEEDKKKENIQKINDLLDKKVLDGVNYTDEQMDTVRKALFVKSEVLTLEDGRRIRVTPYYKKKYERSKNEEQALKDVADFILGYDIDSISNKSRKSARVDLVDKLNDLIEVDVDVKPKVTPSANATEGEIIRREL